MHNSSFRVEGDGPALAAILRTPDDRTADALPTIVHGPGWLGVAGSASYLPYHQALTEAGFAVVVFDYRGFGGSEGDPSRIDPYEQVADWRRVVRWVRNHRDLHADRVGIFGSGATGGGGAFLVAAAEPAIRAVVAQVPIADGLDWLRRMRDADAWRRFVERVEADRARRAEGQPGEMVAPRVDLTPTAGDRAGWKRDVEDPARVHLAAADALFAYRPLDAAPSVGAVMVIAVEDDDVTPTDHARRLYEAARPPKRLVLQRGTTHYRAYTDHRETVVPMIVGWFREHMSDRRDAEADADVDEEVVIVGTAA